ncbi:MAG: hypothetical protein IKU68_05605 [Oscillospiraceae bacterium]|nr:hypothetical protein [Oscillospiraceae bacterium]
MKTVGKVVLLVIMMVIVMGYTTYNYLAGQIDMTMFLVSMLIVGIPLFNMVNILIRQWKSKD